MWAAGAAASGPLAHPAVLGLLASAGLLDVAFAAARPDPEAGAGEPSGSAAAVAALAALGVAAASLALARPAAGVRLALTALAGGGLAAGLALRPAYRTLPHLLAAALAYAVLFRTLASPVLPLGPILAYWLLVGAAALALVAGTRTALGPGLPAGTRRHEQDVVVRRDPLDRGLGAAFEAYLSGAAPPDRLVERARRVDPDAADRLAHQLPQARDREARTRAIAAALDLEDLSP